jgi:hypothetical protein
MSLADRLKEMARQQEAKLSSEKAVELTQEKIDEFITANARPEFEHLLKSIGSKIAEVNPALDNLPRFVPNSDNSMVMQGNVAAYINFDKPMINRPDNRLLISFGFRPDAMFFNEDDRPESLRYVLQAATTEGLNALVWEGQLGELNSDQLADFTLETLTTYFLEHSKGRN